MPSCPVAVDGVEIVGVALDAVWAYREAVRHELEGQVLTPAVFGWSAWDGRERCPHCAGGQASPVA